MAPIIYIGHVADPKQEEEMSKKMPYVFWMFFILGAIFAYGWPSGGQRHAANAPTVFIDQ